MPVLAFAAFLLTRYAATERARYERDAVQIARQVALVVDGELGGLAALLNGLASSSALARDDLAQLHLEARRLVEGRAAIVVLRDLEARQFFNTGRPFGTELPPAIPMAAEDRAAFAAGRVRVSQVYASPLTGETRVAVALPIMRAGEPTYVLAITVPTLRIRDALLPAVPPGWIVGVGDRDGTFVTRSQRHEDVTGKRGVPEYLEKASGRSGTFTSVNFEGTKLLAGYYRSEFSDWLFGANVPQQVVEAPLWRSLAALAALGAAALTLSVLLAYLFGRGFTAATTDLAARATALGEGRSVPATSSHLAEFALVGDALASAAAAVEERTREREKGEEQRQLLINELNHRVKNTLASVQSIALQTLRGASSLQEAREALSDRLVALAKAHDMLTRESWEGAELHDIVAGAISAHGGPNRFVIKGPPVWLTPALSLSLALALHELATNAAKYGALSNENGSVAISWEVADPLGEPRLTLRWAERGGPPVQPPTRQGFGSRLIQRSLSAEIGGTATVDYAPQGLVCVMQAPIRQRTPSAEQASAAYQNAQ